MKPCCSIENTPSPARPLAIPQHLTRITAVRRTHTFWYPIKAGSFGRERAIEYMIHSYLLITSNNVFRLFVRKTSKNTNDSCEGHQPDQRKYQPSHRRPFLRDHKLNNMDTPIRSNSRTRRRPTYNPELPTSFAIIWPRSASPSDPASGLLRSSSDSSSELGGSKGPSP